MAVNFLINVLFHVGWGIFMIAETARLGGDSTSACEFKKDSDFAESLCNGYGAGAAFSMFAAIAAFVAAALAKRGPMSWYPFIGSLALYTLAMVSAAGGNSEAWCHKDVDADELCSGYTAATLFYFVAFAVLIGVLALMWKMAEPKFYSITAFFTYLAIFAIGWMCELGGVASDSCESDNDDDSTETRCSGFGFAAFVAALAMLVAAIFAALSFAKKDTGSNLWIGVSVFLVFFVLSYAVLVGTEANACDEEDADDDAAEKYCSGSGAATFFYLVGVLLAIGAAFFSYRAHDAFKQALFLGTFALFYLAYVSFRGGKSAEVCESIEENDPKGSEKRSAQGICGGYGAAAFFAFVAFVILAVAAGLTQTAKGAPTADEPTEADASAPPQQEKDVPVVTAVPVNDDGQSNKNGANV